jgi:hypothetical protein
MGRFRLILSNSSSDKGSPFFKDSISIDAVGGLAERIPEGPKMQALTTMLTTFGDFRPESSGAMVSSNPIHGAGFMFTVVLGEDGSI